MTKLVDLDAVLKQMNNHLPGNVHKDYLRRALQKLPTVLPTQPAQAGNEAILREVLYRLKTECEIEGLCDKAGFDCWIHMANEALAAPATPLDAVESVCRFNGDDERCDCSPGNVHSKCRTSCGETGTRPKRQFPKYVAPVVLRDPVAVIEGLRAKWASQWDNAVETMSADELLLGRKVATADEILVALRAKTQETQS